jgi:hypothetical protein
MAKIGRNERCPCGSGHKYKKCCIDKPRLITDLQTKTILDLFKSHFEEIKAAHEATAAKIRERIAGFYPSLGSSIETDALIIRQYVDWLESQCASILSQQDPVFWLSLDRRVPSWINLQASRGPNRELIQYEASSIKTMLCLKYSAEQSSPINLYLDSTFAFDITPSDIVQYFGAFETLIIELTHMQGTYRRLNKGAQLQLRDDGTLDAVASEEMRDLMLLYDLRRQTYSASFSPIGFFPAFEAVQTFPSVAFKEEKRSTIAFIHNNDPEYIFDVGDIGRIKGPNFLPYRVPLDSLDSLSPFEQSVVTLTGMTLLELRLCFVALKDYICDRWLLDAAKFTYVSRRLTFSEPAFFTEKLSEGLKALMEAEGKLGVDTDALIAKFIDLLSSPQGVKKYDPLSRRGMAALHASSTAYTLDLSMVTVVLGQLFMDLQLDSTMRQIKGATFEIEFANRLHADCPNAEFPIKPGLKLRRKGQKDPFAEVDIFVQVGSILFLVECKAYSLTREYLRGDVKAVTNRRILLEEWLDLSDRRAKEIAAVREGANYLLPQEVTRIVPVVCSAFPEFTWSLA